MHVARALDLPKDAHPISPHIFRLLRRVQALLDLQTVNAQKNLDENLKSNLDRMIRAEFGHQTP